MADTYAYNDVAEQPTKTKVKDSGCVKVAVQIMEEVYACYLSFTKGFCAHHVAVGQCFQRLRYTQSGTFYSFVGVYRRYCCSRKTTSALHGR